MRGDLNAVANNVDVMSYDVKDNTSKVETLYAEFSMQKQIIDLLKKDDKTNRILACTALAFGVIGTADSVASIGMQLSPKGVWNGIEHEMNGTSIAVSELDLFNRVITMSITINISPVF